MLSIYNYPNCQEYNSLLLDVIALEQKRYPGSQLGVGSGWSGPKNLLDRTPLIPLTSFIINKLALGELSHCNRYTLRGWGNVLEAGDSIGTHSHTLKGMQNPIHSGVYYITAGTIKLNKSYWHMEPGQLLIMPSDMLHSVDSVNEYRVSIAFNCHRR